MSVAAALLSNAPLPPGSVPGASVPPGSATPSGFAGVLAAALPPGGPVVAEDVVTEDVVTVDAVPETAALAGGAPSVSMTVADGEPAVLPGKGGGDAAAKPEAVGSGRRRAMEPGEIAVAPPPRAKRASIEAVSAGRTDDAVAGEPVVAVPAAPALVSWIMAGMAPPYATPEAGSEGGSALAMAGGSASGLDRMMQPGLVRGGWALASLPTPVAAAAVDSAHDGVDAMPGEGDFIPSPRFALAVLNAAPAAAAPLALLQADEMANVVGGERHREEPVMEASSDTPTPQPLTAPGGAAPWRQAGDAVTREAAPLRPAAAAPVPVVTSQQLGEVRIGLEGGTQDLRVTLSVGSGAAVVVADAPRLAADLAANGLRLQSLDVSDGGAAMAGGGGSTSGSWNSAAGSESRPRFAPPPAAAANAFVADQPAILPQRSRSASDRYA